MMTKEQIPTMESDIKALLKGIREPTQTERLITELESKREKAAKVSYSEIDEAVKATYETIKEILSDAKRLLRDADCAIRPTKIDEKDPILLSLDQEISWASHKPTKLLHFPIILDRKYARLLDDCGLPSENFIVKSMSQGLIYRHDLLPHPKGWGFH